MIQASVNAQASLRDPQNMKSLPLPHFRKLLKEASQALTSGQAVAVCQWKEVSASALPSAHSAPGQTE